MNSTSFGGPEKLPSLLHRARAMGQDPDLLRQIRAGEVHPAMAAYGPWRDEEDLARLTDEVYANRSRQAPQPEIEL